MLRFVKYYQSILVLFFFLFLLVSLNTYVSSGSNSVIVNEIFFDPVGTDLGKEWIELYNPTDYTISIENWKILTAGTTFSEVTTFSGSIPPHEYFLVCEMMVEGCNVNLSKLSLQNGGGATDALSISNSQSIVIDQVFYDTPNTNLLKNSLDLVVENTQVAIIGRSGESLGRSQFIDTDNSFEDFYVFEKPTPGQKNDEDIVDEQLPQTGNSPIYWLSFLLILVISGILLIRNNLYNQSNAKNT